ncbi:MAG: polyisoprenoid-binding protein [Candidatus Zixiibacteriota bacterium]|nr:MAG: polyisoprenoid-binding protein [candidate division Zixibacteria bacterium]
MRSKFALSALTIIIATAGMAVAAEKYVIDQTHSSVEFSVKHLVITNVKGGFTDFTGSIMFDTADVSRSSVNVTIKSASINTNDDGRDKHLRSEDFFDVEKFPEITFNSTKIEKTEKGLIAHGNLTMHGVTKNITIPFELTGPITDPWGKKRIGVEAGLTLDRKDYGIKWNKILDNGGLTVSDKVKIELNIEAIES